MNNDIPVRELAGQLGTHVLDTASDLIVSSSTNCHFQIHMGWQSEAVAMTHTVELLDSAYQVML